VNKQLIYYYFENKDTLFTHVLQVAYQDIRTKEAALELDHLPARDAVLELMDFTWHYYLENPEFIQLLNSENQLKARHLKEVDTIVPINSSWLSITQRILDAASRMERSAPVSMRCSSTSPCQRWDFSI
jgi:AcrR family transcriptional regulator